MTSLVWTALSGLVLFIVTVVPRAAPLGCRRPRRRRWIRNARS